MLSSSNIQIMSSAILKAAKNLRRDFGELEKLQNSKTSINSFVENSFNNTKEIIFTELKNARPDWSFFVKRYDFEELKENNEKLCVIKPISGIANFAKGVSYFASSAIYFNNNIPEAVVIYDPIKDELFFSDKGRGAFVNNSRIRFSSTKNLSEAIFVFDNKELLFNASIIGYLKNIETEVRIFGSSCLDIANLASGKVDCYVSQNKLENTLEPGLLLVKEAGGISYQNKTQEGITFYANNDITDILRNKL